MSSPHTATKSSPRSPQLEKAHAQQHRPNAAKKKTSQLALSPNSSLHQQNGSGKRIAVSMKTKLNTLESLRKGGKPTNQQKTVAKLDLGRDNCKRLGGKS